MRYQIEVDLGIELHCSSLLIVPHSYTHTFARGYIETLSSINDYYGQGHMHTRTSCTCMNISMQVCLCVEEPSASQRRQPRCDLHT